MAIQGFWAIFSHEANDMRDIASEISVISPAVIRWLNINQCSPLYKIKNRDKITNQNYACVNKSKKFVFLN